MKILICDPIADEGIKILKEEFDVDVKIKLNHVELKSIVENYDALIVRSETKITKEIIESGKNLKVIGRAGVGIDNIDVETATKKGIIVINVPDGNTISAAEHTIGLLLSLSRNIVAGSVSLKEGKWERSKLVGHQLFDKTLGIIGLGRIGKVVDEYAKGLKMQVIAYDPYISENVAKQIGIKLVSLLELLSESDYISLHIPLTSHTKHLISEKEINLMKKSVMIINCARGGIIDEAALYDALKNNRIDGAALDVFEKEPPAGNPLLTLPNVILTPHLGASTKEALISVSTVCANQIKQVLKGEIVSGAVNLPAVDKEFFTKFYPYISLAEKLGSLQGQIIDTSVVSVEITCSGELSKYNTTPITLAVIKGLLQELISDNVSYVNARILADERKISIIEKQSNEQTNFSNLISIAVATSDKKIEVAGTIFNVDDQKIVMMDKVYLDAEPSGYLLIIYNEDKPGVVGKVGTILGENNINIAGIYLGRQSPGGKAISIINVDCSVPEQIIEKIKKITLINEVKLVKL